MVIAIAAYLLLGSSSAPVPTLADQAAERGLKPGTAEYDASLVPSSSSSSSDKKAASSATAAAATPVPREKVDPEKYTTAPKEPWKRDLAHLSLTNQVDDKDKVTRFLAQIPSLPPEGKVIAMDYATKLIPDEEYLQYRPTLFGLVSSPEMRETVMLDALTRGEDLRMPTLVEMLRQPENPLQAEIREILFAYTEVDYGKDVNAWDEAVKKYLRENPDI